MKNKEVTGPKIFHNTPGTKKSAKYFYNLLKKNYILN
jgi:hypothetical protein